MFWHENHTYSLRNNMVNLEDEKTYWIIQLFKLFCLTFSIFSISKDSLLSNCLLIVTIYPSWSRRIWRCMHFRIWALVRIEIICIYRAIICLRAWIYSYVLCRRRISHTWSFNCSMGGRITLCSLRR